MRSKFKDEHPFGTYYHCPQSSCSHELLTRSPSPEKRKQEAERIRQKYPDRIPVSFSLLTLATFLVPDRSGIDSR
jgi:hypothetical protein